MAAKPGLMSTDGVYGAWKTTFATWLILEALKDPNTYVFSNIWLNFTHSRVVYYEETTDVFDPNTKKMRTEYGLLKVLRFIWQFVTDLRANGCPRDKLPRFIIVEDEAGITYNQHDRLNFPLEFMNYLLQVRKIQITCRLVAQNFMNITKQIRQHVSYVYTLRNFFDAEDGFRSRFVNVYREERDDNNNVICDRYRAYDNWVPYIDEVPRRKRVKWLYKPHMRPFYDDLHLNKPLPFYPYKSFPQEFVGIAYYALEYITKKLQKKKLALKDPKFLEKTDNKHSEERFKDTLEELSKPRYKKLFTSLKKKNVGTIEDLVSSFEGNYVSNEPIEDDSKYSQSRLSVIRGLSDNKQSMTNKWDSKVSN